MKRIVLLALVAVVFVGCQDRILPTDPGFEAANFEISDGAHGGNADVFFLPPLVPDPSGDPEFGDRDANPDLEGGVAARICELGGDCFPDLPMAFQELGGFYRTNWHTRGLSLPSTIHRITIVLGSGDAALEFAFRDVTPVKKAKGSCKSEENCEFRNGSTLPIKVRIESGAACLAIDPDFFENDPLKACLTAFVDADESLQLENAGSATPDTPGVLTIEFCTDLRDRSGAATGKVDIPTFGPCIEITPLTDDLSGFATLCEAFDIATGAGVSVAQARRMTVHRFGEGDLGAVALPHSDGPDCVPSAPEQALELNSLERFVRFARNTWRAVSDRVVAWIEPAPLYARTMFRCNRGGCSGDGPFRSSYQAALPAWMDFDPAGPSDGDFEDVLVGEELSLSVNAMDSGENESPTPNGPGEPVEGVRLTFAVTAGGSFTGPEVCAGEVTCTLNTDGDGNAAVTIAVVLNANTVVVSGIGVGTDGLEGTILNVFGPSINDPEGDDPEVPLGEGTLTFTATGIQPDLIVFSLTHSPDEPVTGEAVTLTAVVKNIGTADAAASLVSVAVDDEDTPPTFEVPLLAPGASASASRIGDLAAGERTVTATADAGGTIPEILESNNTETDVFTVVEAAVLFGSSSGGSTPDPGSLFQIDETTGLATLIGSTGINGGRGVPEVSGIDFDPTNGVLYGVTGSACSGATLITIDPNTGAGTMVGPMVGSGFDGTLLPRCQGGSDAIAFDVDGTLYAGGWNGGTPGGKIMRVNPASGAVLELHATPGHLAGLAFAASGDLWVSRGGNGVGLVHIVDPSTGAFTTTLVLSESVVVSDLAFAADGTLFATLPQENQLATINTTTGLLTRVGSLEAAVTKMSGLAIKR